MMGSLSAEETKQELESKLGPTAGRYVYHLLCDLVSIRSTWRAYRAFFGTNPERVSLLNSISGSTAVILENSLRHEAILGICRITDPMLGRRQSFKNITILGLSSYSRPENKDTLDRLAEKARKDCEFARPLRDKVLAHSDDGTRNNILDPISSGSRADIEASINSIALCLKAFYEMELRTTLVTHPTPPLDDEVSLIEAIYLGKMEQDRRLEERRRALSEGLWEAMDDNLPGWVKLRPDRRTD